MLPLVIIAAVVVPLLVLAFLAVRRSAEADEHPAGETDADRLRTEQEFEESERFQAEWREEQHKHPPDSTLP
ncbi:MAG TPA: hypothetical protein VHQ98_10825 [Gaiellaceae bacterium]|nr:hypothetical protein [Gaiellaceae bacterium]